MRLIEKLNCQKHAASSIKVCGYLKNLRNMALDMDTELENQNNQIDRITIKVGNVL